ncbi:unnamed protein product [Calypogeia fissa]
MGGLTEGSFGKVLFCVAILSTFVISASALSCASGAATTVTTVVRDLSDTHGDSYGRPGLSHLTIAGALLHGLKEVEVWLQTFAPGSATPVHRHDCEEVFLILKGKGTLYLAPSSNAQYPGTPREFSIGANSTFIVPVNEVHQIRNTNKNEDLQHLAIISRPPIRVFTYEDWYTPHTEAQEVSPYPWDADLISSAEGQCGALFTRTSY